MNACGNGQHCVFVHHAVSIPPYTSSSHHVGNARIACVKYAAYWYIVHICIFIQENTPIVIYYVSAFYRITRPTGPRSDNMWSNRYVRANLIPKDEGHNKWNWSDENRNTFLWTRIPKNSRKKISSSTTVDEQTIFGWWWTDLKCQIQISPQALGRICVLSPDFYFKTNIIPSVDKTINILGESFKEFNRLLLF